MRRLSGLPHVLVTVKVFKLHVHLELVSAHRNPRLHKHKACQIQLSYQLSLALARLLRHFGTRHIIYNCAAWELSGV